MHFVVPARQIWFPRLGLCFVLCTAALCTACGAPDHRAYAEAACDKEEACGTLDEVYEDRKTCLRENRRSSREAYREHRAKHSPACADAEYDYRFCFVQEREEECRDRGSSPVEMWCEDPYMRFLDACD